MRILRALHRRYWDDERRGELDAYLAEETADNLARGMTPDAARTAAHRKLGSVTRIREEIYEMNSLGFLETLWQDLRYGARVLRRNPTFALVTILTLALGTGANTAIFQLIEAVNLRTLPVSHPDQLLELKILNAKHGRMGSFNGSRPNFSNLVWERIQADQRVFSGVLAWTTTQWDLAPAGESRPVQGLYVSGGYFSTLGVAARVGRVFTAADDRPGCGTPGAVISDAFWQREYGGDPSAVGRSIVLDGRAVDIIGVTPASFFGTQVGRSFDVAMPLCADAVFSPRPRLKRPDFWFLGVFGRLKPGVNREQAAAQLRTISAGIFRDTTPANYDPSTARDYQTFEIGTLPASTGFSSLRANYADSLGVLLALTGIVLLIACANLANLMLARATAREREIAVRLAIGASRPRIIRQMVSESLLIAGLGAAAGLLAAQWFSRALVSFLDSDSTRVFVDVELNAKAFGFAAVVAAAAALAFGLVPAIRATRTSPNTAIKASSRSVTDSRERFGLRRLLVVAQVALSLMMVIGALLFVRSLWKLTHVDPGFRTDGVLVASVDYRKAGIPEPARGAFERQIVERLRALPGVTGAARASDAPLAGNSWNQHVVVGGAEQQTNVNFNSVTPGYFDVLRTPLVAGRDFDDHDTPESPLVAVVTESFARSFFPHGAVGQTFQIVEDVGVARPPIRVVGVVKDSKYGDLREPFTPLAVMDGAQDKEFDGSSDVVIRATTGLTAVSAAATRALLELNGSIVVRYQSMASIVAATLVRDRLMATLSGFFGALAVLIAAIGLYGVMAYTVARRKVEIGIRMALGADRRAVVGMIVREALVLLAAGAAVGLAAAIPGAHLASALLYGLQPADVPTLAASLTLLAFITTAASCIPAWRASRVAPTVALRED
ncbi:MAG TPA: ABC transporter permease [Vicinamibacterales bacterium]|jgi:predicted permease